MYISHACDVPNAGFALQWLKIVNRLKLQFCEIMLDGPTVTAVGTGTACSHLGLIELT